MEEQIAGSVIALVEGAARSEWPVVNVLRSCGDDSRDAPERRLWVPLYGSSRAFWSVSAERYAPSISLMARSSMASTS